MNVHRLPLKRALPAAALHARSALLTAVKQCILGEKRAAASGFFCLLHVDTLGPSDALARSDCARELLSLRGACVAQDPTSHSVERGLSELRGVVILPTSSSQAIHGLTIGDCRLLLT